MFQEPLFTILPNIINKPEFSVLSDYLLSAISQLIILPPNPQIELVNHVLDLLPETREATDSVFRFIAICRSSIFELDEQFPKYLEVFVQPALQLDPPPIESIAIMVTEFTPNVIPTDFLVEITKAGLDILDSNTNIAVMNMWKAIVIYQNHKETEYVAETVNDIIPATFAAIVSTLHSSCFENLQSFFCELVHFVRMNTDQQAAAIEQLCQVFNSQDALNFVLLFKQYEWMLEEQIFHLGLMKTK